MKKIVGIVLLLSIYYSQDMNDLFSKGSNTDKRNAIQMSDDINLTNFESLTYTPVEKPIDPNTYILGPGDLLGINIISTKNVSLPIRVNPVGEILIPSVGVLYVNGITLSESKEIIAEYIKEIAFQNSVVNVTLLDVKRFKIQLLGAVNNPGYLYVSALDKLYDVILQSGGLQKFAHPDLIQIKRNKGTINVNLKEYLSGKDMSQNIYLNSGDIIFVPFNDYANLNELNMVELNQNHVVVYGFVNKGAGGNTFKYFPGYTVRDYIALAGGTKEQGSSFKSGNINNAKLYRSDGTKIRRAINEVVLPGDMIEVPPSLLYQIVGGDGVIRTLASIASSAYIIYRFSQEN